MALNRLGEEQKYGPQNRPIAPVTLPAIKLPPIDPKAEAAEAADDARRVAVTRTIRPGRDACERIGDSNSFSAWCKIGAALHIGKTHALRTSGANSAWGSTYSRAFNKWMSEHGFGAMRPSDRSYAVCLHENLPGIEGWCATLPDKQRRRLRGAQQNVKRWRKETSTTASLSRARGDDVARVLAAWRRFVSCVSALPAHEAGPLWEMAFNEAAAHA